MLRHAEFHRIVAAGWLGALILSAALPQICAAQGVPVVDASAIEAAQQNLKALQDQLKQLTEVVKTAQNLAQTIGAAGNPSVLFQQTLSQSGLGQLSTLSTTALSGGVAGSGLSSVLSQMGNLSGASAQLTQKPDFSTFDGAQKWVSSALTTAPTASSTAKDLGRQARQMVAGEAAADGYALALTARQQVGAMANRAQSLASQVSAATTLRDDIAANTAVMLAVHDEMAEIQALLASLLAVQSSDDLVTGDDTPLAAGKSE